MKKRTMAALLMVDAVEGGSSLPLARVLEDKERRLKSHTHSDDVARDLITKS